jgi:hypothetical protein
MPELQRAFARALYIKAPPLDQHGGGIDEARRAIPALEAEPSEAAALANYLRVTWGGQKDDVTPAMVRALR